MSNLKSSVLHSLKWVAISKLAVQLFRWFSTFYVIRLLVPEDYAIIAISDMVAGYLVAFSSLGLGAIVVSKRVVTQRFLREMMTFSIIVNLSLFLIQWFLSDILAQAFLISELEVVLKVSACCYLLNIFTLIPTSLLTREMKFKFISLVELIAGLSSAATTIFMANLGFGYWSLVGGYIAMELVKFIGFFVVPNGHSISRCYRPTLPRRRTLKLMRYSMSVALSEMLFHARDSIDVVLGGLLLNKKELGLYNVGLQVSSMPLRKIAPPIRKVAFPAIAKFRNDRKRLSEHMSNVMGVVFFISIPLFWGIASVADLLVPLVLGQHWSEASIVVAGLCLVMPFRFAEEILHPVLKGLQDGKAMIRLNAIALVLFGASVAIGCQYGLHGLVASWLVSAPVIFGTACFIVARSLSVRSSKLLNGCFTAFLSGLLMLAAVMVARNLDAHPSLIIGVSALLGLAAFIVPMIAIKHPALANIKSLRRS